MNLAEIMPRELVCVPLTATDKYAAITELIDLIAEKGRVSRRDQLLGAVLERESQRTTGIGRGFAVPHAKCDAVSSVVIALGRTAVPIEYDAIDGQPVSVIALLASPVNETRGHMQALAALSRLAMNDKARRGLIEAPDAESMYHAAIECSIGQ